MNTNILSIKYFFGKALRWPLKSVPPKLQVPIMSGGLRGYKWITGAGNHSHWLGTYEYKKQKAFTKTIKSGSVVYDIGGHVGFYTLLSSALVGSGGRVYVFEPLPRNIGFLKKHLKLNEVNNVQILSCAVSDSGKTMNFLEGPNSYMGRLSPRGKIKVKAVTVDDLCLVGKIVPPDYIKIDVEGAEYLVLKGAEGVLSKYKPVIFLSTHGDKVHQKCISFLKSLGFVFSAVSKDKMKLSDEIIAKPQRIQKKAIYENHRPVE